MKITISAISAILGFVIASVCFSAPMLTTPSLTNVGANMATLNLQSSNTGTGYFTLRSGTDANCGAGSDIAFGPYSSGSYHGSLPLNANVAGKYTVRNLRQNTPYTVCFTADDATVPSLNQTPVFANISTTSAKALAFPGWGTVGSAGFSSSPAHFTSLAFAPDGTPYVAYVDANDSYKISVMSYNGSNWIMVGNPGFAAGSDKPVSLAFAPDGTPHLSFVDAGYSTQVMKFNGFDTWIPVGTGVLADTDSTSLAFTPDGTPLVAYIDGSDSTAHVMTYSDGNWNSTAVSTASAATPSLAIAPDGTPYLAYSDHGNAGKATVMQYIGTAWTTVGNAGFSAGTVTNGSLAIAPDGSLYLAYQDGAAAGKATVMTFSGESWSLVGTAGFTAGTASTISLAVAPDGKPAVAYQDGADSARATVMKYNGSAWGVVAGAGFSTAMASSPSLAFAPDGSPYVAYGDNGNGSKATVMMLTDIKPAINGTPPATATVGMTYSFTPEASFATGFTIENQPSWASFNTSNGTLSGVPQQGDIGTFPGIVITATNSVGSTNLPTFSIVVSEPTVTGSVKIGTTSFLTISAALAAALSGDTLEILATIAPEGVNYSGSGIITLEGGYNEDWSPNPNLFSTVSSLTITGGTLIIDKIAVSGP